MSRFNQSHIDEWRKEGFVLIPNFFSPEEIEPIVQDYKRIYGTTGADKQEDAQLEDGAFGEFNEKQFTNIDVLPYNAGSSEMNLISLHPDLIDLSKALLSTPEVHLYQSHTWAKFTGDADYTQPFHCDFGNHTLTVPSDDVAKRTVDIIIYFTDVTDEHGAMHFVPKPAADEVLRDGAIWAQDQARQDALKEHEKSAAAPAGSILAHGIDTFHRGTNLTIPGGVRYTMTVGYKAAGNDMIGYHVWQTGSERDWTAVLGTASPEQLNCLGIPRPGDDFWTERTLKLTQARWPDWDMQTYFAAAGFDRKQSA